MSAPNGSRPRILFASSNPEKVKEVRLVLARFGFRIQGKKLELPEPRLDYPEEVVVEKVKAAYRLLRRPVLAEDTGIYFKAYKNFPGIYAAFAFRALGFDGLLCLVNGKDRHALFRTAVAYCDSPHRAPKVFIGESKGTILRKPESRGVRGIRFPYERIFLPRGSRKPLSRMSAEEKAAFSHRSIALQKFARWYLKKN